MHSRSYTAHHALRGKRPSTKDAVGMRSCASDFWWAEAVRSCGTKGCGHVASSHRLRPLFSDAQERIPTVRLFEEALR